MTDIPEIEDVKTVYVAWINSDTTEGRGRLIPLHVCDSISSAKRLGAGKNVQGSNADVTPHVAIKVNGHWYAPCRIYTPSIEDDANDKALDMRNKAIEKAKKLGLSDDEVAAIRLGK